MQLHECLLLAVHPPTADLPLSMPDANANNDDDALFGYTEQQFFTNASSGLTTTISQLTPSSEQRSLVAPPKIYTQGSVLSMMQCIVHEWGTNSRTNFYIPPEQYAGYSYLCDEECPPSSGWWWRRWTYSSAQHYSHCVTHPNCHDHDHHHHHPTSTFVHAEEIHNLHPHHHDNLLMMMRANNTTTMTTMSTTLLPNKSMEQQLSLPIAMTSSSLSNSYDSFHNHIGWHYNSKSTTTTTTTTTHAPMSSNNHNHIDYTSATLTMTTVPYIHPNLEMPVPPLHLPLYFGILCWSFAFAGVLMLRLPQKWTLHGGQPHRCDNRHNEECSRHWFPYRVFAWVLILWQSPCSFLADYVHMTNISVWHVIDRFSACIMMILELVKLVTMRPYTRPIIYILYLVSCGIAMYCFLKGQESLQLLSEDGFVFWHCGWHCYPLIASIVHILEILLNKRYGEYYKFGCNDDDAEDDHGHADHRERICEKNGNSSNKMHTNTVTTNVNSALPPTSRRSRRIAGLKPEKQCCL